MSEGLRKYAIKYGITGVVCIGFAVFYCVARDFAQLSLAQRYRILCDAFTVPGILAMCVGALLWVSNDGFFCGLGYCLDVTWKSLVPGGRKKIEKYYDYVQRKKDKKVKGFGFLFVCGGVCLAVALVFLVLFYGI